MHIASITIDLGKTTFHLVALGERNKVLVRKKFSRSQLFAHTAKLPSSLIGLEACAGAHFVGAALREQGHQVRLIPAQFVKPYRKSNKNDFIDGEAIAEAVTKQNMRFAQLKTQEQLDWQAMHRERDRLVQRRTALINEIRGFLLERGITFAAQPIHLRKNLPAVIEDAEQNLSPRLRWLLDRMWQEWKQIEIDVSAITEEIERISNDDPRCRQLRQIPGFGPLISTATVAAIGNGAAFRRGRDFAPWVGVVPRQHSTGGKQRLYGISKDVAEFLVSVQVRHFGGHNVPVSLLLTFHLQVAYEVRHALAHPQCSFAGLGDRSQFGLGLRYPLAIVADAESDRIGCRAPQATRS